MDDRPARDPEAELNAARLRHGHAVICDRCGDTLTLSSMTPAPLESHLLRTAVALDWQVSATTSAGLGSTPEQRYDRDLCPACRRLFQTQVR